MSAAPISAPEKVAEEPPALALLHAGWRREELTWEALEARAFGVPGAEAGALRAQALLLARETFEANDPRLACALANHAASLRASGDGAAEGLFREALLTWDRSGPWLESLKADRRARSATYHLRLLTRYPGGYDHWWRERYAALAAEGRAALQALAKGEDSRAQERLSRWRKERPEGFTDLRRLMAASLLIA